MTRLARYLFTILAGVAVVPATVSAASAADTAGSETAVVLDLAAAVDMALAGNYELRLTRARVSAAAAAAEEPGAGRKPQVVFEELASRTTQPAAVFSQLLGQEAFTSAAFDPDYLNQPDALNNFTSRLTVHQTLWAGGRTAGSQQAAREAHQAEMLGHQRRQREVIHHVVRSYSAVLLAWDRVDVALQAQATATEHVRMAEDLHDGGLVVNADVLLARVRLSEVNEMVATALAEHRVAEAEFNLVLGREQGAAVNLDRAAMSPPAASAEPASAEALVAEAWEQRRDLQAAAHRVAASDQERRHAGAGYRPQVGVLGALEANAEDFIGADGTNWTVMATLRWSIFDGGATRSRVRQAGAAGTIARLEQDLLRQRIALEVRQALSRKTIAGEKLSLAGQAAGMARESLRIVADRYAEGLAPLVQLLEAEDALTRARFRQVAARREQFVADSWLDVVVDRRDSRESSGGAS